MYYILLRLDRCSGYEYRFLITYVCEMLSVKHTTTFPTRTHTHDATPWAICRMHTYLIVYSFGLLVGWLIRQLVHCLVGFSSEKERERGRRTEDKATATESKLSRLHVKKHFVLKVRSICR